MTSLLEEAVRNYEDLRDLASQKMNRDPKMMRKIFIDLRSE